MKILLSLSVALLSAMPAVAQTCAIDWTEARVPSSIGDAAMAPAMDALLAAYRKARPNDAPPQQWKHPGEAAAIGAVMFATADMAPITRAFQPAELSPYDHQYRGDMMKAPFQPRIGTINGKPAVIAVNRRPDSPLPPRIANFLEFALSAAGQKVLAGVPGFTPLDAAALATERGRIGGFVSRLDPGLPSYTPVAGLSGDISSDGSDGMKDLLDGWQCRFAVLQPGVAKGERWEHFGTMNGFHALIAGQADLAPMGRELWPQEAAAWASVMGTPAPVEIRVARGGFNTPQRTTAQAVFVHPSNPLTRLNVAQLADIFGENPKITRWGQLGLKGEWADRPIAIRMPPRIAPNSMSMQMMVLNGKPWRADVIEAPYADTAKALVADPAAIGFGGLEEGAPGLKALAIASGATRDYVPLDAPNATSGRYPLTRYMFIRLAAGTPKPQVKAFLRYVLSREGQERVRYSGYHPLNAAEVRAELAKLDAL